ncbi:MAG: FoF1 ATP synthase subunit gamma [Rhodospirillaceae bacterium]
MVERLAEIQARIANLGDLQDIMAAMRALAGMRLARAQSALPGIRQYTEVINFALARGLALTGEAGRHVGGAQSSGGRMAVVAFTSEHGFAGAYNEHVLDAAWQLAADGHRLLVVGSRGRIKADERGYTVAYWQPMATHIDGVLDIVLRCAEEIYKRLAQDVERVTLVFGRLSGGVSWKVGVEPVLPFDAGAFTRADAVAPMVYLDPTDLFDKVVEEFLFTRLMHAALESFASENAARLTAMEAAHDNIESKLENLNRQACQQRQEEITTELLDVVIGATAARRN